MAKLKCASCGGAKKMKTGGSKMKKYGDGGPTEDTPSFKDVKKSAKQDQKLAKITAKTARINAGTEPTLYDKASKITGNIADAAGSAATIVNAVKDRTGGSGSGSGPGGMQRKGGSVKRMGRGGMMAPPKKVIPRAQKGRIVTTAPTDSSGQAMLRAMNAALGLRDSDTVLKAKRSVAKERAKIAEQKKLAYKKKSGTIPKAKDGLGLSATERNAIHGINQTLGLNDRSYTNSKGTTTKTHSSEGGKKYIKVTRADGTTYNKIAPSNVVNIRKNGGPVKYAMGGSAGVVGMPKYGNNPRTQTGAMVKKGGAIKAKFGASVPVQRSPTPGRVRSASGVGTVPVGKRKMGGTTKKK